VNGWIESSPSIADDVGVSCVFDMAFDNTPIRTIFGNTPNRSILKERHVRLAQLSGHR
jgi:hypothetical protein